MKKWLKKITVFLLMVFLSCWMVSAQETTITGNVSLQNGESLPGVSVLVKGTSIGTVTDENGEFSLNVPNEANTLVFTFIGMKTKEVPITSSNIYNVILEEDTYALEEVVAIGYGTVKKSDLTGAVSSVKSEELDALPIRSIDQALQGRATGVQVIQGNGSPGASSTIRIRGTNSIQGGNDPLVIVDGFPVTGGLGSVSPSDIQNIEILKDASSTAIYGARASNGVIIITTKTGKSGKTKIDVNSYYGVQTLSKKLDMLNAEQFMEIANERAKNDNESELFFPNPSSITADTDWIDEITDPAAVQSHSITFSGGNEKVKFSHSFNYYDQDGVILESYYKKGTMRNNLEVAVTDWLTISNSALLVRSNSRSSSAGGESTAYGSALIAPPTVPVYDENGDYSDITPYAFSPGAIENPVAKLMESYNKSLTTRIFDNFYALVTLMPGLTLKSSVGIDYLTNQYEYYNNRKIKAGLPSGKGGKSTYENYSILNENTLNFSKSFENSNLNAVAGYTWQKYNSRNFSASSTGFVTDELMMNVLQSGAEPLPPSSGGTEWGIQSFLARVNYTYKDRYLITINGRADGASRFAEGNKWAYFPSTALAWRVSEEDFWNKGGNLSSMKLRTSWGVTGNQAISPFSTWQKMSSVTLAMGNQLQIGYAPGSIANKDLQWETTSQFDVGADLGILDERFRFTLDYYYKKTTNLLAQVDLPPSSGYNSSTQNIGEMENQGVEFNINGAILEGEFKWDASFNIYANKNKILKLSKGADVFASKVENMIPTMHILREGEPISMFYGYIRDGFTETGQVQYKDIAGRDEEGNLVYEPDGTVNDDDRDFIGSPHPDFQFGFNNTFSFKGFTLDLFLEGSQGFQIINGQREKLANSFYKGQNQLAEVYGNWWTPGNSDVDYPIPSVNNTFKQSDDWVEDGSYIKIRTITFAYNFDVNKIDWLENAQIYLNGQNLFTFTKYSGIDPEIAQFSSGDLRLGVDQYTYPKTKTISLGVKLGF